jgi:hypothetical protein
MLVRKRTDVHQTLVLVSPSPPWWALPDARLSAPRRSTGRKPVNSKDGRVPVDRNLSNDRLSVFHQFEASSMSRGAAKRTYSNTDLEQPLNQSFLLAFSTDIAAFVRLFVPGAPPLSQKGEIEMRRQLIASFLILSRSHSW